jgi:hypothetical protein
MSTTDQVLRFERNDSTRPLVWMLVVGVAIILGAIVAYRRVQPGAIAVFGPVLLVFVGIALHRRGFEVDAKERRVVVWRWLLFRWQRAIEVGDEPFVVSQRLHSPKDGDSYWVGIVSLAGVVLYKDKKEAAWRVAEEAAAHLGVKVASG